MQIHEIKRTHPNKKARRIGRGGVHGKTSGRGTKGQKARAGRKMRPELRDIIKKLPKLRGHGKNRARSVDSSVVKPTVVKLSMIEKFFDGGAAVTPATLMEKEVIRSLKGKVPQVKLLGTGDLTKKVSVSGCLVSASAKAKIEKAGGSVA
ncbi:MAG: 50S ribosomal protein L15 [Parcubacteria group bacterium]|nr:50S ribosomal protein L15 [Parcubacteria group bacterium]